MRIKHTLISILLALFLITVIAMPVFAIADPDSPPSINAVYGFTFEDGSAGFLMDYFLDYAALPTEPATEAYLGVFVDTDGTTQLKSIAPYSYNDSGYGRGVIWIYFTAAEVTAYSIDAASIADYRIWLTGNPTLAWAGDPPKTIGAINSWQTTGTITSLFAIRILNIASALELEWSVDLVESTSIGNRLTTTGIDYFENAISSLRTLAPNVYSDSSENPIIEDIDYTSGFGATATSGTGTIAGSPVTLVAGANSVNVTALGTVVITLAQGTTGTAASNVATVAGSPVSLIPGTNTITVGGVIGLITVTVAQTDTQGNINTSTTGTAFDLTTIATSFGMSRLMFSGLIWMIITVIICSAVMKIPNTEGKGVLLAFDICIIGGTLLGMLHIIVGVLLAIGISALIGYVFFYRQANI